MDVCEVQVLFLPFLLSLRKAASQYKLLTFSLLCVFPFGSEKGFFRFSRKKEVFPRPSFPPGLLQALQLSHANDAFYADEFITFCFGSLSLSFLS